MGEDNTQKIENKNNETEFIQKFGFDKIMQLDKETNGIFSRKIHKENMPEGMLMSIFANKYIETKDIYNQKETSNPMTYEKFKNIIYEYLIELKKDGIFQNPEIVGDLTDYDFIKGQFREEHPEIFINENIAPELKTKYYQGRISAEEIKNNPEIYEILKTKRVDDIFKQKMKKAYLLQELDKNDFIELCKEYGKYFDNPTIIEQLNNIKCKDETLERIRENINMQIYNLIKLKRIEYDEELPETFKNQYKDLFLPTIISEELRNKFCKGEMTFEDIRKEPKLEDILLEKDLDIAFRKIKEGSNPLQLFKEPDNKEGRGKIDENWDIFSKDRILNLAKEYGRYLEIIDCNIFEDTQNFEQKKERIQEEIDKKIQTKEIKYGEDVPNFFKEKYPELILDENSPEELKEYYYDGYKLNFEELQKNPEWKEYLKDKNLKRALPEKYSKLIEAFETNDLIKVGTKNLETVNTMVERKKEECLKTWYRATGGKYIPDTLVMLNVGEKDIDNFLINSAEWLKIKNEEIEENQKIEKLKEIYAHKQENNIKEYSEEDNEQYTQIIDKWLNNEESEEIEEEPQEINNNIFEEITPQEINNNIFEETPPQEINNNIFEETPPEEISNNIFEATPLLQGIDENTPLLQEQNEEPQQEPNENKIEEQPQETNENKIEEQPQEMNENYAMPKFERIEETEEIIIPQEPKTEPHQEEHHEEVYKSMHDRKTEIPIYDKNTMRQIVLRMMKRLEAEKGNSRLNNLQETKEDYMFPEPQRIINSIAREYKINPDETRIMATNEMAIIFEEGAERTKISDIFVTTKDWEKCINELRTGLKQIENIGKYINTTELSDQQKEIIKTAIGM